MTPRYIAARGASILDSVLIAREQRRRAAADLRHLRRELLQALSDWQELDGADRARARRILRIAIADLRAAAETLTIADGALIVTTANHPTSHRIR